MLGFVDIQAGHAQNRFFNQMEEWLIGVTRLVETDEETETHAAAPAAAMGNIVDNLDDLIEQMQKNNQAMAILMEKHLDKAKGKEK